MKILLVSSEKNLGLLTLTDFILDKLGKDSCAVLGANYLVSDLSKVLDKIEEHSKDNKNVIIKYVIPLKRFSNQGIKYPQELGDLSDLVLKVPTLLEELDTSKPLEVYKGSDNPFIKNIGNYYNKKT